MYLLVGTMQLALIAMGAWFKLAGETQPHEVRRESLTALHFDDWNGSRRSIASSNVASDQPSPLLPTEMWRKPGMEGEQEPLVSSMTPVFRSQERLAVTTSPARC